MAERVTGPDGSAWTVRRRWWSGGRRPRWRRYRLGRFTAGDVVEGAGEGLAVGLVFLAFAAVVLTLLWFVFPLAIFLVELVIAGLALTGRLLARRPWIVEAVADGWRTHRWEVTGWRASGRHVELVAGQLAGGLPLPEATTVDP
jgi:hypothetical protein